MEVKAHVVPVVRSSDGGVVGDESKRARVEEAKKQRVQRLRMEYEQRISAGSDSVQGVLHHG